MATRSERLAAAWLEAREWFEAGAGDPEAAVHVGWRGVAGDQLRPTLEWIEAQAIVCYTSSVWRRHEELDAGVAGAVRSLAALVDGRLASLSLHYEVALERQALGFLITIARQEDGSLTVRGFTRQDLVRPALGARVAFETIAGHALDLEERLRAAGMWIGPERDDLVPASRDGWMGG